MGKKMEREKKIQKRAKKRKWLREKMSARETDRDKD